MSIQVVRVPEELLEWVREWDGFTVSPPGREVSRLSLADTRRLCSDPELCLLPHEEGRVQKASRRATEFSTPPRPSMASSSSTSQGGPPPEELPPDGDVRDMYDQEVTRGASGTQAVDLVSSAYGLEPSWVQGSLFRSAEKVSPLPSFPSSDDRARPTASSGSTPELPLVAPSGSKSSIGNPGKANPLLYNQPRPVSAGAGFQTSSLFHNRKVAGPTELPMSFLGAPPDKRGASFSEALPTPGIGAPPGLSTDRIIHAIDGLRKAQDEDKTGTKGTLSALKEPEKWMCS